MGGVISIGTITCFPWHLRCLVDQALARDCRYCGRAVAVPPLQAHRIVSCIPCSMDRGMLPAIDKPFDEDTESC